MTAQEFDEAICHIRKNLKEYEAWKLKYNEKPHDYYYHFGYHFNKQTDLFYCNPGEWQKTFRAIREIFEKEGYKVHWWHPENCGNSIFYTLCISWD